MKIDDPVPEHCQSVTQHRVIVAETDMMNIVYHGNYTHYLERGRLDYMRCRNLPYKQVVERGLHFPIVDLRLSYKQPARFDDLLLIETRLSQFTRATIGFEYLVYRFNDDLSDSKTLLTEGSTRQACIGNTGRPQAVPADIMEHLLAPGTADTQPSCRMATARA